MRNSAKGTPELRRRTGINKFGDSNVMRRRIKRFHQRSSPQKTFVDAIQMRATAAVDAKGAIATQTIAGATLATAGQA